MPETTTLATVFYDIESIGDDSPLSVELGKSLLSPDEVDRASSFRFDKHRNRFIRGRTFLRTRLGKFLDIDPAKLNFIYGERGKPSVEGSDIAFNLSHTDEFALLAVSNDHTEIGVDIESVERQINLEGLSRQCFTNKERSLLERISSTEEKTELFFRIWTAKEARMKLSGEGFYLSPLTIETEFFGKTPVSFSAPNPRGIKLHSFNHGENLIGSVAAYEPFQLEALNS